MKKRILQFMPFLAALTLAGCASEEIVTDETGSNDNKGLNYIAMNIVQPKENSVRAGETEDKFENGSDNENDAKNAYFCIFDENGNFYGEKENKLISAKIEKKGTTSTTEGEEKLYEALVVIEESKNKPVNQVKKLVCFLNLTDNQKTELEKADDLSSLMSVVNDYREGVKIDDNTNSLIMSNSVYFGENSQSEPYTYAKIEEENLATSKDDAANNPVNVYVERVVAKVRAHANNGIFENKEGAEVVINGDGVDSHTYAIKITGIEVANVGKKAYIGKQLGNATYNDNSWTIKDAMFSDSWNQPSYHRYNWEIMPTGTSTELYENKSYKGIVESVKKEYGYPANKNFEEYNIADLSEKPFSQYVQPNTSDQHSAILVTAQLMEHNAPVGTFVYLRGFYYKEDAAKQKVANYLRDNGYYMNYGSETEPNYDAINASEIEWAWKDSNGKVIETLKDYEVVPQVKKETEVYKKSTNSSGVDEYKKCDTAEYNDFLISGNDASNDKPYFKARVFTDGMCYYYTNIQHDTTKVINKDGTEKTEPLYGVVRNHIYDLTLNSIKGLGVPVYDPEKPIIPDTPDTKTYFLDANVTVLSWRVKSQTVDFVGN